MARPGISDEDFIHNFETHGAAQTAVVAGVNIRQVYLRRRGIERRLGITITAPNRRAQPQEYPQRTTYQLDVKNGSVIIGSDAHYWPNDISTAHLAFCKLSDELKPKAVIANGDVVDAASLSRFDPIGWETQPEFADELEAAQARLMEIEEAAPKAKKIWNLGNHDSRFEGAIAKRLPELKRVKGVHLKDHFPKWITAWACFINNDVVVKHRFKGGIHATHNNTMWAGRTMVTGHLHSQKVAPFTDYNGTRWGVDSGTMAEPRGPQFTNYTELNPLNWRSGFCILTFKDGRLLTPELVSVHEKGKVEFRGEIIDVE